MDGKGQEGAVRPAKRRKLPPPSFSSDPPPKVDDPSKYQGRTRAIPHVIGDWPSHVFIELKPSSSEAADLRALVEGIVNSDGTGREHPWHSLLDRPDAEQDGGAKGLPTLHLSLSRLFALKTSQRDDFRAELRKNFRGASECAVSFASLCPLVNDQRTRAFVSLEVGAGHDELRTLTDKVDSVLDGFRLPLYYPGSTRFHASVAWCLYHVSSSKPSSDEDVGTPDPAAARPPDDARSGAVEPSPLTRQNDAPAPITEESVISSTVLKGLEGSEVMQRLRRIRWKAENVTLRIGRTDYVIPLTP